MCHWQKWILPGFLTVALLAALALWSKTGVIQDDISSRTTGALQDQGYNWAKIAINGRDVTLFGAAPDENQRQLAALLASDTYDVRVVDEQTTLIPLQNPYTISVKWDAGKLIFAGFVPNEAIRTDVITAAKTTMGDVDVTDSLVLARGAPQGFSKIVSFGLEQLSGLNDAEMMLSDTALSISGTAVDFDAFNSITTALDGSLPGDAMIDVREITAPRISPYTWSARYADGKAVLSGYVPSKAVAASIVDQTKQALSGVEIVDQQVVAGGAPSNFSTATGFAVSQLQLFSNGSVGLSDGNFSISGVSLNSDKFIAAKSAVVGALPTGMTLVSNKIVPAIVVPYIWSATYDGTRTVLDGYIPNTAARGAIISKAITELPKAAIVDNMQIALGAPQNFTKAATGAIAQLPYFSSGSVGLNAANLSVEGKATSPFSYATATKALATISPSGFSLAGANIIPASVSPYEWSVMVDKANVTLSGYVPDAKARTSMIAAAKASMPDVSIADEMQIALGSPVNFSDATAMAIAQVSRFSVGSVSMSDALLSVDGTAKSPSAYASVLAALVDKMPGGFSLSSENITPASIAPYLWGATFNGTQITLNGYVPNNEVRKSIVAMAKAKHPDATINDTMQIASGAPASFNSGIGHALAHLPHLLSGSVSLKDMRLSVEGRSRSPSAYVLLTAKMASDLPPGLRLGRRDIAPAVVSPYSWKAVYDGTSVELSGFVPATKARRRIIANVGGHFPNAKIVDSMQIAAGAPIAYEKGAFFALQLLSNLESGSVDLNNMRLSASGRARSPLDHRAAEEAMFSAFPADFERGTTHLRPAIVSPYTWSAKYDGASLALDGFVPGKDIKMQILTGAARQLPSAKIVDTLQIADGAPADFGLMVGKAIALMPHFSRGNVSLSGGDLNIDGAARSKEDFEILAALIKEIPAVNITATKISTESVAKNVGPAAKEAETMAAKDYVWSAQRTDKSVVLTGYAPSAQAGVALGRHAKTVSPDQTIDNRLAVRDDAPAGFMSIAYKALNLLGGMKTGVASITNQSVSIAGQASSVHTYTTALAETAEELPQGFTWKVGKIKPVSMSPYTWALEKGADTATQSGFVPTSDMGKMFARDMRVAFGKEVDNTQRVALGAPDGFNQAVLAMIAAVGKLDSSYASIIDTTMLVLGRSNSAAGAKSVHDEIAASIPANFRFRSQISYPLPKPKACDVNFSELFADETIRFSPNRAVIQRESYPLLAQIAAAVKLCPKANFEIGGYTDSRGSFSYNRRLSEARAMVVAKYLTRAGIYSGSMTAKGYGETGPIASNNTPQGRALNRRIDFTVLNN